MADITVSTTLDSLMAVSRKRLNGTLLSAENPGGVVRLLLSIVNSIAQDIYTQLATDQLNAFLSTAADSDLDAIGYLMDCTRLTNETDDNYRYRISKQTSTAASANRVAVKLAVLSIDGVTDCTLTPYTYGTGSGSIYVVTSDPYPTDAFIATIQAAVDDIIAFGNKVVVTVPKQIPVEIGMKLVFKKTASSASQAVILTEANTALKSYVAALVPGDSISIKGLQSAIMAVSKDIFDVQIFKFIINSKPALLVDQDSTSQQRFVESTNADALQVV